MNKNLEMVERTWSALEDMYTVGSYESRVAMICRLIGYNPNTGSSSSVALLEGRIKSDLDTDSNSVARYNQICRILEGAERLIPILINAGKDIADFVSFLKRVNGSLPTFCTESVGAENADVPDTGSLDFSQFSVLYSGGSISPAEMLDSGHLINTITMHYRKPAVYQTIDQEYLQFSTLQQIGSFIQLCQSARPGEIHEFQKQAFTLLKPLIMESRIQLPAVIMSRKWFSVNGGQITAGRFKVVGAHKKIQHVGEADRAVNYVHKDVVDSLVGHIQVYFILGGNDMTEMKTKNTNTRGAGKSEHLPVTVRREDLIQYLSQLSCDEITLDIHNFPDDGYTALCAEISGGTGDDWVPICDVSKIRMQTDHFRRKNPMNPPQPIDAFR